MDRGRGNPNPWLNRTFFQTCPRLGEGPSGDNLQGKRESSRKGPYRANPGARGRVTGREDRVAQGKPAGSGLSPTL